MSVAQKSRPVMNPARVSGRPFSGGVRGLPKKNSPPPKKKKGFLNLFFQNAQLLLCRLLANCPPPPPQQKKNPSTPPQGWNSPGNPRPAYTGVNLFYTILTLEVEMNFPENAYYACLVPKRWISYNRINLSWIVWIRPRYNLDCVLL